MYEFRDQGLYVSIDERECYADDDNSYVIYGYVDSPEGSGRLLAVGDARGEVEYVVESMADDGGEGPDLEMTLPLPVLLEMSARSVRALREHAA